VSYRSGDETVQAILYMPKGEGSFLRWWSSTNGGSERLVKEQASNFADQGYVALAIDLYRARWRRLPMKRTRSCAAFPRTANRDLLARRLPAIAEDRELQRVGAIGWCMAAAMRSTWRSRSQAEGCCHQLRAPGQRQNHAEEDSCPDSRDFCGRTKHFRPDVHKFETDMKPSIRKSTSTSSPTRTWLRKSQQ